MAMYKNRLEKLQSRSPINDAASFRELVHRLSPPRLPSATQGELTLEVRLWVPWAEVIRVKRGTWRTHFRIDLRTFLSSYRKSMTVARL